MNSFNIVRARELAHGASALVLGSAPFRRFTFGEMVEHAHGSVCLKTDEEVLWVNEDQPVLLGDVPNRIEHARGVLEDPEDGEIHLGSLVSYLRVLCKDAVKLLVPGDSAGVTGAILPDLRHDASYGLEVGIAKHGSMWAVRVHVASRRQAIFDRLDRRETLVLLRCGSLDAALSTAATLATFFEEAH